MPTELPVVLAELSQIKSPSRRDFLSTSMLGAAGAGMVALLASATKAQAAPLSMGDAAVLDFLNVAEQLETDLWQQYSDLAQGNRFYKASLRLIDPSLPDYITGDFNDEASHAALIQAFLTVNGSTFTDLTPFKTIPGSMATGSTGAMRLTNLTTLNVDTSYYNRYRTAANPDLDTDPPAQIATIAGATAIPRNNTETRNARNLLIIAQTAAFHFGMIEQGGSSLYTALMGKVSDPAVLRILAGIGPTEFWHFSLFMSSLEGIRPYTTAAATFPNLRTNPTRGRITPHPARYFAAGLPLNSVVRPSSIAQAGAVATVTALANSNLFDGQPPEFFTAATNLATAADGATRNF